MITGTVGEISNKYALNGVIITQQEWYVLIRILEKAGVSTIIDRKNDQVVGPKTKIYNVPSSFLIKIDPK
jgi:hypothetical protein